MLSYKTYEKTWQNATDKVLKLCSQLTDEIYNIEFSNLLNVIILCAIKTRIEYSPYYETHL